jgi:GntR family transcriptional regulator
MTECQDKHMSGDYAFTADELGSLDSTSFVPLYMQLASQMAALIRAQGEAAFGKVLPSESECVQRFGVSRPTVRQAMAYLLSQGLIMREKGRGTFVAKPKLEHDVSHGFEDDMRAGHHSVQYTLLSWERRTPAPQIRDVFAIDGPAECYALRRLRSVDGKLIGVEERWLPEFIGQQITHSDLDTESAVHLAQKFSRQKIARQAGEVSAMTATRELAELLKVKPGAALLVRQTTFIAEAGSALMHGTVTFVAEHYKFKYTINHSR